MTAPVRILVVGVGNMGASACRAPITAMEGFEIVGLCAVPSRRKTLPDELAGYPRFDDYETALAETEARRRLDQHLAQHPR
jgi:predicted dehydrogenase